MNVVITGGASGLGLAMAKRWAQTGASICLVDRDDKNKESAMAEVEKAGGKAFFFQADVTNDDNIGALKTYTDNELGKIDVLINSAGVPTAGTVDSESLNAWQWVFDINVFGSVRLIKTYAADMRRQGKGHIVNVASQAGITPAPLMGSYSASKAAMVALSESLRMELAPFGVGVSVLCPAFVQTNLHTSLLGEQDNMKETVTKLVTTGNLSADNVAQQTFQAVQENRLMIVTHKEGRLAWRLKRFLPALYFSRMTKRTRKFAIRGYENESSHTA